MNSTNNTSAQKLFAGAGVMRERCRSLDWARTPLGEVACWPASLQTAAQTVLAGGFPMMLLWGADFVQLFNDAYLPLLGSKQQGALGQPTRECWPEVWHITAPIYARVMHGETVTLEDSRFPLRRNGPASPVEDVYLTLSYSALPDGDGGVGGVLVTTIDTTAQVLSRAVQAERDALAARLNGALLEAALVVHQMRESYKLLDAEFRIIAINPSGERALNRTRSELLGRSQWELFPASVGTEIERQYRRVATEHVEAHFEHHYVGEGRDLYLEIDAYPTSGGGVAVFWRDVSERLLLEAAAEQARVNAEARAATLAAIVQSIPDALLVAHHNNVLRANDAALKTLGLAPTAPDNSGLVDIALPLEALLCDRETGAPLPFEVTPIGQAFVGTRAHGHFLLAARSGSHPPRPVRAAAAPILGATGHVTGVVTVLTDMTAVQRASEERDRLLAALEAERTLLRTVLDQLPAAVFVVEAPSGRILALNDAVARVWGEPRPLTDAVEHYSNDWVGYHVDGRRIASQEWPVARALRGETVSEWTCEIERPDGERVLIEVSAVPVHNVGGETVAAVGVANDITARVMAARERERLLHALDVERARLAYVFEQAPTFLAVTRGPTHVFELANSAYYNLVGRHDLIGQTLVDALPEVREQGFVELLDHVLATGEPFVGREVPIRLARARHDEPEDRVVDFVYLPLVEADGTRSGIISHGTDVTEQVESRHEIERLLRESECARAEAEAANRGKSEFLAVMSHELRTPLNAIGGYAELLTMGVSGEVTDAQRADIARIKSSQEHLLKLINRVLNYATLGAGAVSFEITAVPLHAVLTTCEALVITQATQKQLVLDFAACDARLRARADREKLEQVLVNLLSNAVKFTDAGGSVSVSCESVDVEGEDGAQIAIRVTDTGHGIAPEQLERVFEPFVQVDAVLTRAQEGTGLGLAISRDLARGMGGDLTVESTFGEGSTFTLLLPAA